MALGERVPYPTHFSNRLFLVAGLTVTLFYMGNDGAELGGVLTMPAYRIYTLSRDGHIHSAPRLIECDGDDAALKEARRFLDGEALEVWDQQRKIGRLEPE